jgi:DNA-binding LacI/PurR family transcriptional regulator
MPRPRVVTLIDVARAAGVSRTTASAALGGAGRISDATRDRVRATAGRLGYVANPAARHLQGGRKGAVGLYVPDNLTGFSFYMEFAFGAAEALREDAFALTLLLGAPDRPAPALLAHVDGFVLVDPVVDDPFVPPLLESAVPVVSAERYLGEGPQPRVTVETDHGAGIAELLEHFWERGARWPALLTFELEFAWTRVVEHAYRSWCAGRGVEPRIRTLPAAGDPESVRGVARRLLEEPSPPDAILSGPDGTALGVLGAARDVGRAVGADLLVASAVDSLPLQMASPAITAITLQPRDIGRHAAGLLSQLLRGEEPPATVSRGRPPIAVRASTGARVGAATGC